MNLDFINNIINETKSNKFIQNFIKELENYLEKNILKNNYENFEKEDILLINSTLSENKIITQYRDKMYLERSNILNNYAKETSDKGQMYYIYSKNSKLENGYNLCICEDGKSHTVIETSKNELPKEAKLGSVLRKIDKKYILDTEATEKISNEIYKMKDRLLKEQKEFLNSKRIEEHIYEMSEKCNDRACLFDVTDNNETFKEGIEEVDFPKELLKDAKQGDLFIYKNGEYQKYLKHLE
ncbi:MAG: DUF3006 domain-containing protein [Candidatus Scatovivens sp.]